MVAKYNNIAANLTKIISKIFTIYTLKGNVMTNFFFVPMCR